MKKMLVLLTVVLLATNSSALALSFTDVGGYDLFKAASSDNMNGPGEAAWIAGLYGYSVDEIEYTKWDAKAVTWTKVDDASGTTYDSAIYFDFETDANTDAGSLPDQDPFAFLIKAKSGDSIKFTYGDNDASNDVSGSSFLFTNLDFTRYGVIDLDWFIADVGKFTIETISHTSIGYGEGGGGGGGGAPIPEPSTWILLGAGLVGLAFWRRKKS